MKYDRAFFDAGLERHNTRCEKWDDRGVLSEEGIALWVADMDFRCAQPIVDAIMERAQHPCYGYNIDDCTDEEALIGYWQRRHQLNIRKGQTKMLPCVVTGLKSCVRAFTNEGDKVAIFTPIYGPFYASIQENKRIPELVGLIPGEDGRYQMNLSGMEKALQNGAKLIMLCNPHNPISRAWEKEELEGLLALAERYDVPLVSDEIHADFVYAPRKFVPILSIPGAQKRAIMLCAASKTFNVAGLQQATCVSFNPDYLKKIGEKISAAGVTSGNTFALYATKAAYEQGDAWLDGLMEYLDENRKALAELVEKYLPKAKLTPVEATYLAWLDLRAYGKTCQEMTEAFMKNGVALTTGVFFGEDADGFMRINFGCPRGMLEEGIRRMANALKED